MENRTGAAANIWWFRVAGCHCFKTTLLQDTDYKVEKTDHLAPYLGTFRAYLMPQYHIGYKKCSHTHKLLLRLTLSSIQLSVVSMCLWPTFNLNGPIKIRFIFAEMDKSWKPLKSWNTWPQPLSLNQILCTSLIQHLSSYWQV